MSSRTLSHREPKTATRSSEDTSRESPAKVDTPVRVVLQTTPDIGGAVWRFIVLVALALALWTFADALEHSDEPAVLWTLVVFLAPLVGIVLYLLVGRTTSLR